MVVCAVGVPENEICKTFRLILLICGFSINVKPKISVAFHTMWVMKRTFVGKRRTKGRLYHTLFHSVI